MAVNYTANQYEDAFVSKKLQSWEVPKPAGARPGNTKTVTRPVANDNGHLLPGYRRENTAWTGFVGTWDMPKKLPGNNIDNPTARDARAYEKLRKDYEESKLQLTGQKFNYRAPRTSYGASQSFRPASGGDADQEFFASPPPDGGAFEGGDLDGGSALEFPPTAGDDSARGGGSARGREDELSNRIPKPDFSEEMERRHGENGHYVVAL